MKGLGITVSVISLVSCSSVYAAITSLSAGITEISAPVSFESGALESSSNIFLLAEKQSYVLTNDLSVDLDMSDSNFGAGFISAGTKIDSYFLHSDPLGNSTVQDVFSNYSYLIGQITFDTPILGVIWTGAACSFPCPSSPMNLDASDFLGAANTIYPTNGFERGYETGDYYFLGSKDITDWYEHDNISVTSNPPGSIAITSSTYPASYDQLRIITASSVVPLPAAVWLFGSGIIGLVGIAGRKKI